MELVDVHAHLCDEKFDDVKEVIARAVESGIKKIICASSNISSSQKSVELAKKYDNVFATVGVHPEDVEEWNADSLKTLQALASEGKVIAIGEIGLDYHYFSGKSPQEIEENKKLQKMVFIEQLKLANGLNLPVQIHSRDAMGDTIEILKEIPLQRESLLHCYSGSIECARILMELGFSFSFGGVVTFSNAKNVQEVVKNLPIEKIMLETDCPYLSPVPFRSTRNEPKNVVYVADEIARLKNMSLEEIARITTQNAARMFKI